MYILHLTRKMLCFLVLLGLHSAAAVTHSMKCYYTASSQVQNVPEFVVVTMVDDVQVCHYDSNIRRVVSKQDWMNRLTEDHPEFLKSRTNFLRGQQQVYKGYIEILKTLFNQSGGIHVYQMMHGCEWDDETGHVQNGFTWIGYDEEGFISFDLKTGTWIALKQQAEIIKLEWDTDKAKTIWLKHYLNQRCPYYLEKFVNYGRSSLMRTDLPSVFLLQKTPSSPVSCFATGFYPNRAEMFWRKDGEKIHEDVELGEILPNHDGSFQMSVDLNISSVTLEDWRRYECVFHLSGVKDDIITKLNKTAIQTNWRKTGNDGGFPLGAVTGPVIVLLLLVVCIVGYFLWRKNKGKDGFQSANTASETSGSSVEVSVPDDVPYHTVFFRFILDSPLHPSVQLSTLDSFFLHLLASSY